MNILRTGSIRWFFALLLGGYALYLIQDIARHPEDAHWDLRTYYLAAQASSHGENPYDQSALARLTSGPTPLRFVYSPLTLPLFKVLLAFDYPTTDRLWLGLQILSLVTLGILWRRFILGADADLTFWFFCLLAYNSPLYIGLVSGNVVLFEQVLIWAAFAMFLRKRYGLFVALLCFASVFKLTPILLVAALLFSDSPRRVRYVILAVAAFLLIQLGTFFWMPASYRDFIAGISSLEEWGLSNPSTYALVVELFRTVFGPHPIPAVIPAIVYAACAASAVVIAFGALRDIGRSNHPDRQAIVAFILIIAYIVVLPRAKNYSFALLLPPTYWIMKRGLRVSVFGALLVLSGFLTFTLPGIKEVTLVLWTYLPLLMAWGILVLYGTWARRVAADAVAVRGSDQGG